MCSEDQHALPHMLYSVREWCITEGHSIAICNTLNPLPESSWGVLPLCRNCAYVDPATVLKSWPITTAMQRCWLSDLDRWSGVFDPLQSGSQVVHFHCTDILVMGWKILGASHTVKCWICSWSCIIPSSNLHPNPMPPACPPYSISPPLPILKIFT